MCHNSGVQSAQIDKCVENGMPQKIVKTVQYTIRKRTAEEQLRQDKIKEAEEAAAAIAAAKELAQFKYNNIAAAQDMLARRTSAVGAATDRHRLSSGFTGAGGGGCPFRYMREKAQSIANITDISSEDFQDTISLQNNNNNNNVYTDDVLAKGTLWTKRFTEHLSQQVQRFQSSKLYTLLTKTTQPAHLIAICILSLILLTVWPEIIKNSELAASKTEQQNNHKQHESNTSRGSHPLFVIAYLGAFATHFGAQIWMTFVSGLSLYFALPRHTFGQCQQILFPKYFALNAVLSLMMFFIFVKYILSNWCIAECVQLSSLALTALIEVTVRLYLAPPMLRLMHEKYRIEEAVGSGQEIGGLVQGDLVQCPHYQLIHKTFRRIHMTIAIGNIVILLCTCLHLYYLASKINFQ